MLSFIRVQFECAGHGGGIPGQSCCKCIVAKVTTAVSLVTDAISEYCMMRVCTVEQDWHCNSCDEDVGGFAWYGCMQER